MDVFYTSTHDVRVTFIDDEEELKGIRRLLFGQGGVALVVPFEGHNATITNIMENTKRNADKYFDSKYQRIRAGNNIIHIIYRDGGTKDLRIKAVQLLVENRRPYDTVHRHP